VSRAVAIVDFARRVKVKDERGNRQLATLDANPLVSLVFLIIKSRRTTTPVSVEVREAKEKPAP